ncbi:MAG: DUF1841 family protein [Burkholderiaceae bacterium]
MFDPSQAEVRQFFCRTWQKELKQQVLTPMEAIALDIIKVHPEYHEDLADEDAAVQASYSVEQGRTNPFLHLSMHLAIAEQQSIDQPPGIREALQSLSSRLDSEHDAVHAVMECLGQVVWEAQRNNTMPDHDAYLACIKRQASTS